MTTRQILNRAVIGLAVLALLGLAQGTAQAQPPQAPPTDQVFAPGPPPPDAGQFEGIAPQQDQLRGQRGPRGLGNQQGLPPRRGQFQDQRGPRGPQGADPGHTPGECDMTGPHGRRPQDGAMGQRNVQQGARGQFGPQGPGAGMGPGRPMGPPAFEAIDADGNGAITKAEWDQFHAQRAPRGLDGPDGVGAPGGPRGPRGQIGPEGARGPRGPRAQGQELPPPPAIE